jgi:hypothetical protein
MAQAQLKTRAQAQLMAATQTRPTALIWAPGRPKFYEKKKRLKFTGAPAFRVSTAPRSMYSDVFSVMQSQLEYGTATSPSLRKRPSVWKYERNLIGFVPTVEQMEGKKKRGLRLF